MALLVAPRAFGQLPGQQAYALLQQQGNKLVGTGASGASQQGNSVAISADGNTAIVGGPDDNSNIGGAWVFTRANGVWSQQGTELIGTGAVGAAQQGWSVAISGDGNTALVGGPGDFGGIGAAWVFTRSAGVWTQQAELRGAVPGTPGAQGSSVAISGDGNTAALGADNLNNGAGGIFVFTRGAGSWSQQGGALIVNAFGETGAGQFGYSVAMSLDGNKIIGGANLDNSGAGAAWLFKRSAGVWSIGAGRLLGAGATGNANQGSAVATSGDGNVIAIGGPLDSAGAGAVWIYTFQVDHFGAAGGNITVSSTDGVGGSAFGSSLSLSRDGSVLVVGGSGDNRNDGAVWQFGRTDLLSWTQQGTKLVPSDESAGSEVGKSVALSADGNTGFFGGISDGSGTGAGWPFDNNVYLGSPNVGSTATENIALQVQNAFTVGSIAVVTQGASNLDFTAAASQPSSGACQTGAVFTSGSTCSIDIKFAPTAAGLRLGAVLLFDGSDVLQATVFLHGTGLGPVVSFSNPEIDTVAGDGTFNSSGDGGPALSAELKSPFGLTADAGSDLYINDFDAANIRFVDEQLSAVTALGVLVQAGDIQTVVGNGTQGFSGDAGAATLAKVNQTEQLALDGAGNLYIADTHNNRIRKVDARTGIITTFAGGGGSSADGVLATNANTALPQGVVVSPNGDVIIGDTNGSDNKVHRVAATTGIITTIAGTSTQGFGGDGGPATSAAFLGPLALAIDTNGNLYVDDDGNNVIREVNYNTGTITTVAGTPGPTGFSGDAGLATSAQLNDPEGLAVDAAGDIYITDSSNNIVRVVSAFIGIINTIAGSTTTTTGFSGDGGPAINAFFNYPAYPTLDSAGNFYVSDNGNSVVRKIGGAAPLAFGNVQAGATSAAQDVTVSNNGTGPLTLTDLVASANYDVNGGDTTCTATTTLNPGDSCVLGVEFSPIVAGSTRGSVTLVDNAGSQIIPLNGTGLLTSTTTVVAASPNPAAQGQLVTLTATVSPAPIGFPLGTVAFSNGATSLGSGNVDSSGVATFSTAALPIGANSITTLYSGNVGFATSTSAPVTETVNPALTSTSTALSATPNPATVGQSVALTATVSPAPTGGSLGSVSFFNGGTLLGTANLGSSNVVVFSLTSLPTGADMITAVYSGNTGFATSTSTAVTETVNPAITSTSTSLSALPNPATSVQSVAFTATVSPAPTGASLGTVSFFNGSTLLGTANVASSGIATLSLTSLPSGADSITAVYSGNAGFAASTSSTVTETVTGGTTSTTTTLAASPNPATAGQSVTFTATISPAPTGSSLGTVSFYQDATLLGTGTVNSSGVAAFSISSLPGGANGITAVYSGNTGFGTSTSSALTETISPAYTVTAQATAVTVAEGGAVAIGVTVPPVGGAYNSVVTMSASGLPPGATATFNPPTVTPGSAGAPTMLTIQLLTAATAGLPDGPHRKFPFAPASTAVALCLVAFAYRRSRPRIIRSALVLVSFVLIGSVLAACNGGFAGKPGTLPGNYTITITGTSGSLQRSTTITLVVP